MFESRRVVHDHLNEAPYAHVMFSNNACDDHGVWCAGVHAYGAFDMGYQIRMAAELGESFA